LVWYKVEWTRLNGSTRYDESTIYVMPLDNQNLDHGMLNYYWRYASPGDVGNKEWIEAVIDAGNEEDAKVAVIKIVDAINQYELDELISLIAMYIDSEAPIIDIHLDAITTSVKVNTED